MKRTSNQQSPATEPRKLWQNTSFSNLIRYVPSRTYYARIRVGGKLIIRSLKSKVLSVAKLKLSDLEKQERAKLEGRERLRDGKAAFADLVKEYRERLDASPTLKPRTKEYYRERLDALLKSWPALERADVRKLGDDDCQRWAAEYAAKASPTNYNNTIALLRQILDIAVAQGIRYSNPAGKLERVPVRAKELTLPSQEQFLAQVAEIRRVPYGPGLASADLVEFLAYGGFRKTEAAHVTWADCGFDKGEIIVRGDPVTGTKSGKVRRVPMVPDMRRLLERLRATRPDEPLVSSVMRVRECQGAINRACKALGIPRFTHHDLRHLFASQCIESGVDIPTLSHWLGHSDGGALAMKVYGHLRDKHSAKMALQVSFGTVQPPNVLPLPKEAVA